MNDLNPFRKPAAVRRAGGYLFLLAGFHLSYRHGTMRAVVCALWVLTTASCTHAAATLTPLVPLTGDNNCWATGVSGDGSVVVGTSSFQPTYVGTPSYRAFRWTDGSGMVSLGYLPGYNDSLAAGVSVDGSVIVGRSDPAYNSIGQAFRWTAGSGMVGLGYLPGGTNSTATGVSADGSLVVGSSGSASGAQAFRWTADSGMVGLGYLPGDTSSTATGVSADGSVIVGTSFSASGDHAFRWTTRSGMVSLGNLPGDNYIAAVGVSADGSIVLGNETRWTAGSGIQSLCDVLVTNGMDPDWDLYPLEASGISADGNTIVGGCGGIPEGFVAYLPGLIGVSPALSINSWSSTAHQLVLSWSTNYTGCTLQSSTALVSTNWTDCASPTVSGASFVVTNAMSAGAQIYRLKR